MTKALAAFLLASILLQGGSGPADLALPERAALDRITAEALRGDLSFLASDALEGRGTPSRGLDIAAEFIASQFRRAGLEPIAPEGSYFQSAEFVEVTPDLEGFKMSLHAGAGELDMTAAEVRVHATLPLDMKRTPVLALPENGAIPQIEGRVVAGEESRYGTESFLHMLQARRPSLIVLVGDRPEPQEETFLDDRRAGYAPVLHVVNEDAVTALRERQTMTVSVHLKPPITKEVNLRNVAGILRGSDPALRDEFVIVSAHYDHLGLSSRTSGDRVFNGANDNGSGTVSVIELAEALGSLQIHPRRSILFIALFGEEEGLLGSYFYTQHPLVPLKATVADINLEMMGRTDDPAGPEIGAFAVTGMAFSDLPATMASAAKAEGVKVYRRHNEAEFFARSDNYAFALAGVVAHTFLVAFDYPDYHALGDEWQKIDYDNMAKIDKGVGAGILAIANAGARPRWSNGKEAAPYREAGR